MKEHDLIQCPLCGEKSIVKRQTLREGFVRKADILVCSFCGGTLAEAASETVEAQPEETERRKKLSSLAALLDSEIPESSHALLKDGTECHFCKDCQEYIAHPFACRCALTGNVVEAMDDCENFHSKQPKDRLS